MEIPESDLGTWIEQAVSSAAKPCVVGIDGVSGIGKTPIAKRHAGELGGNVVSLDPFLARSRCYAEGIDYKQLRAALLQALESNVVFVEGVCLLEVLKVAGYSPSIHVYLKQYNAKGMWLGRDACFGNLDDDPGLEGGLLDHILRKYHFEFKPISRADVVVRLLRREGLEQGAE